MRLPKLSLPIVPTGLMIALILAATGGNASAQKGVKCDSIFNNVHATVSAEPQKVLAIVEEQVRTYEVCACEIVKAAIHATKANADLINQIKVTAITAAPEQEEVIKACIAALTAKVRSSGKDVVTSSKVVIMDPPVSGGDDYHVIPPDIRGVYLIQPAAGGVFFMDPGDDEKQDDPDERRRRRHPPRRSQPQSPSNATP